MASYEKGKIWLCIEKLKVWVESNVKTSIQIRNFYENFRILPHADSC